MKISRDEAIVLATAMYPLEEGQQVLHHNRGRPNTAQARQLAMFLYWRINRTNFSVTGREFRRDRTSVRHAVEAVTARYHNSSLGPKDFRAWLSQRLAAFDADPV